MVAHIAVAIKMHHERNGGDNHQHQGRNRVEKEAQTDNQVVGKSQPVVIEYH